MPQPTALPVWKELEQHSRKMQADHLRRLFAEDPGRSERFSCEALGLYLDYSKNLVTAETMAAKGPMALATSLAPWANDNSAAAQISGTVNSVLTERRRFSSPTAARATAGLTIK